MKYNSFSVLKSWYVLMRIGSGVSVPGSRLRNIYCSGAFFIRMKM